jgi:hypothetical protein
LIYDPSSIDLGGDAGFPAIEQGKRRSDGVAHLATGLRRDLIALVPGGFDGRLQMRIGHGGAFWANVANLSIGTKPSTAGFSNIQRLLYV